MDTNDNTARLFLRFLELAQHNARTEREVAYYADKLFITPKYLSKVSRSVTGLPASQWIQFYSSFELVSLLNDTTDGDETYNSVMTALKCGYRHIDMAHAYQNECSVGRAVKDSGIDRLEIWIILSLCS